MSENPEFQIFVKPAGAACNLKCTYCYYLEKKVLYSGERNIMSNEVLERYIISHLGVSEGNIIGFSWHGGEPLLAGMDFYRKAVALQKKHKPQGSTIINGIQTNGTLLNEDWCRFFKKENFSVGISIDGPEELHNIHRLKRGGASSFREVMKGYRLLEKWDIPAEVLCVVSARNVSQPEAVYGFFRNIGVRYLTFLPLVQHRPELPGQVSRISVPSEAFGFFLKWIFDAWVSDDIGKIKIQIFEETLRAAFGQDHTLCIFRPVCGRVPVIEHNGDFYSCDHYVDLEHHYGNIMNESLSSLLRCKRQKDFGSAKSGSLPQYCLSCDVRQMCNGECPKNRFLLTPSGQPGLNYLCSGYKIFFNHCQPFIEAVRSQWLSRDPG